MAFKYIALFALVACASAVAIQQYHSGNSHNNYHGSSGLSVGHHQDSGHYHHHEDEHHAPAHYEFAYEVHDEHTKDIKSQKESRHDDKVEGVYTVVEPDGHRRIVHYSADKHSGFNAKVEREFLGHEYVQDNHHNQGHYSHGSQEHHGAQIHKIIAQPVHKIAISEPVHYSSHSGNSHSFGNSHSLGHNSHSLSGNSHGLGHYSNYHH